MKKNIIISTLVIGMLLSGGAVFAAGGMHMNGGGFHGHQGKGMTQEQHQERMESRLARMGVVLDLTDEQKQEFKSLAAANWKSHQAMRAEMMAKQEEGKQQMLAILTPEQRQKAESLRELGGAGFNGMRGGDCDRACDGANQQGKNRMNKHCNK